MLQRQGLRHSLAAGREALVARRTSPNILNGSIKNHARLPALRVSCATAIWEGKSRSGRPLSVLRRGCAEGYNSSSPQAHFPAHTELAVLVEGGVLALAHRERILVLEQALAGLEIDTEDPVRAAGPRARSKDVADSAMRVANLLAFLTCAAVGDSVHVQSTYHRLRDAGRAREDAIVAALRGTSRPLLYTAVTTSFPRRRASTASRSTDRGMTAK